MYIEGGCDMRLQQWLLERKPSFYCFKIFTTSRRITRRRGLSPGLPLECLEDRVLLAFQALLAPTNLSAAPNTAISFDVNYQTQDDAGTPTVLP